MRVPPAPLSLYFPCHRGPIQMASGHFDKKVYRDYRPGDDFQDQIRRYSDVRGRMCDPDLTEYHNPDYSVLSKSQLAYYLYWRDMLSEGRCLPGCRGFASLRIAEIINSDMDPLKGLSELRLMASNPSRLGSELFRARRAMFDYAIVNGLRLDHGYSIDPLEMSMVYSEVSEYPACIDESYNLPLLMRSWDDSWKGIETERIRALFIESLPRVDVHMKEVHGKSIRDMFSTGVETVLYSVFASEPYFGERDYEISFSNMDADGLASYLLGLYKCCASVIAKDAGVKGPNIPLVITKDVRSLVADLFHGVVEPFVPGDRALGTVRTPLSHRERMMREMGEHLGLCDGKPPVLYSSPDWFCCDGIEGMLEDMLFYSVSKGDPCPYVPSNARFIDYANLSPEGLQYYLYWRTMFFQGRILDCDDGYLTLFLSEVINSSMPRKDVLDILLRLDGAFGNTKYGEYVIGRTLFDFTAVNGIVIPKTVSPMREASTNIMMRAFFEGGDVQPDGSCYRSIHDASRSRKVVEYDADLVRILNRVLIRISQSDDPDPRSMYGILGWEMVPEYNYSIMPYSYLAYLGTYHDVSFRIGMSDFHSAGWSANLVDLATYVRKYIDRPSSRSRLKAPHVFGVDVAPLVSEEVRIMEGLDDDGRREKAVESMKLDMGAVESAERDLMEVSEMMHVDDDQSIPDDVPSREQSCVIGEDDDPWAVLWDSIGEEGRAYLLEAMEGARAKPSLERRINDAAMRIIGDVVVQDGCVLDDYMDRLSSLEEVHRCPHRRTWPNWKRTRTMAERGSIGNTPLRSVRTSRPAWCIPNTIFWTMPAGDTISIGGPPLPVAHILRPMRGTYGCTCTSCSSSMMISGRISP